GRGDFRVALLKRQRFSAQPAGRRGFRRVPATRSRRQRRRLAQEPPYRAEAHRAVVHPPPPSVAGAGFSPCDVCLRLSVPARFAIVGAITALLWTLVWLWALA